MNVSQEPRIVELELPASLGGSTGLRAVLAIPVGEGPWPGVVLVPDVQEYPDAGHAFLNDAESGPRILRFALKRILVAGPNPDAAADAWARIEQFFGEHLAADPLR